TTGRMLPAANTRRPAGNILRAGARPLAPAPHLPPAATRPAQIRKTKSPESSPAPLPPSVIITKQVREWKTKSPKAGSGGNRDFIIGSDIVQERAQRLGTFAAECRLELRLRLPPGFERGATPFGPCFSQSQFLAAAIDPSRANRDQALALQRQNVAAERGAVHDELGGKRIDRHGAPALQPCKNEILGRAQAERRQKLIIELRDMTGCLAQRQAVARGRIGPFSCHFRPSARSVYLAYRRIYA